MQKRVNGGEESEEEGENQEISGKRSVLPCRGQYVHCVLRVESKNKKRARHRY